MKTSFFLRRHGLFPILRRAGQQGLRGWLANEGGRCLSTTLISYITEVGQRAPQTTEVAVCQTCPEETAETTAGQIEHAAYKSASAADSSPSSPPS
jgi:hypothetical protein